MVRVSVIMPCYNASAAIKEAINSIICQSLSDLELLIIDDGSTDDTLKFVEEVKDERVRLIKSGVNCGYPVAMNIGIAAAKGKYMARMDADDVCLPSRLEEQLKALQLHPKAAFCGVNRFRITPGNKLFCDRNLPIEQYKIETWEDLMSNHRLFTDPSVMVEIEKVVAVGGYRTFQRTGMDVDLWLRLMERFGPCVTVTSPLFGKRLDPGSLIYKPETALINQVPRILAAERRRSGRDAVERGDAVDLDSWVRQGLIVPLNTRKKRLLLVGTAVACVSFMDWKGFVIYIKHAWLLAPTLKEKVRLLWEFNSKLLRRIRSNPYRLFRISDVGQ